MPAPHTEVVVNFDHLPVCDLCKAEERETLEEAHFDGKTTHGPWAYMCHEHFARYGVGRGLGRGQRLVLERER